MSLSRISGGWNDGTGRKFDWSAVYDDVAKSLTVDGVGDGRACVTVAQADGQRATAAFLQTANDPIPVIAANLPQPTAATKFIVGNPPKVIQPITLLPFPPPPKGGDGGFELVSATWAPV